MSEGKGWFWTVKQGCGTRGSHSPGRVRPSKPQAHRGGGLCKPAAVPPGGQLSARARLGSLLFLSHPDAVHRKVPSSRWTCGYVTVKYLFGKKWIKDSRCNIFMSFPAPVPPLGLLHSLAQPLLSSVSPYLTPCLTILALCAVLSLPL